MGRRYNSADDQVVETQRTRTERTETSHSQSDVVVSEKQYIITRRASLVRRWQNLPLFWRKIICLTALLFLATIAALAIVLLVVIRPPGGEATHNSTRPSPITGDQGTDNATSSQFTHPPVNLALLTNFPDPALHYDSVAKTWYAFGTNQAAGILQLNRDAQDLSRLSLRNIQVARSTDYQHWRLINSTSDPLPDPGRWTKRGTTDISGLPYHSGREPNGSRTLADIPLAVPRANVWAPELLHRPSDGQWVLYYAAAKDTGGVHCIGAAVSASLTGPFLPNDAPIVCPVEQGGAIDPAIFIDEADNNAIHLAYKIDGNTKGFGGECNNMKDPIQPTPIMLQRMQDDGINTDTNTEPVQILDRTQEDGPLVEAPQIVKVDETFFLFYSSGCTRQPDYDLRYATAPSLTGPYERHEPPLLQTEEFKLTAPGSASVRYAGNPLQMGAAGTIGPSEVVAGGQWKLAVHGRVDTTIGGVRALFTAGLDFDSEGVRLVEGSGLVTEL